MLDSKETRTVRAALLRRRAEVATWIEGPMKKATLTAINRMIADLEEERPAAASRGDRR